ncbi:TRAP transporter small permease subunit [Ramlibacter sp.]|uniref:TRAP transporter small permease subunit n=1 Tax=Ramlibacter sp. TaxID=1917967 RepID=UPI002FCBCDB5
MIDRINDAVGRFVALLIVVSILVTMYEVVMRYVFNSPTIWVNESVQILFGFYFLLGGGYTLLHDGHVRVDVLLHGLKPRGRRYANILSLVIVMFYLSVLLYVSASTAFDASVHRERAESAWAPFIFPVLCAAPVAAALMLLQALAMMRREFQTKAAAGTQS